MQINLLATSPVKMKKIWGGNRLGESIGESWEISTHCDGSSIKDPTIKLDYLVKLLNTSDNLSVQVHPDNEYARKYEGSIGKSEAWLILESGPEAGIYLGFKKGVTKKEFQTALTNNLDISQFLNFYPVKKGDFFYVPAGTVHAIGAGVFLMEVQQSSGITYRVWDWNRMGDDGKPRELHITKALDVLQFSDDFNAKLKQFMKQNLFEVNEDITLVENEFFRARILHLSEAREIFLEVNEGLLSLEGKVEVNGQNLPQYSSYLNVEPQKVELSGDNGRLLLVNSVVSV